MVNVKMTLVPIAVSARLASMEMVISVKILMNALLIYTSALFMQRVPILKALMFVHATMDTVEMDFRVTFL